MKNEQLEAFFPHPYFITATATEKDIAGYKSRNHTLFHAREAASRKATKNAFLRVKKEASNECGK